MSALTANSVRHVYAWLASYPDGSEAAIPVTHPDAPHTHNLLLFTDPQAAQRAQPLAQEAADLLGTNVVLAHFAIREDMGILAPTPGRRR